MPARAGLSFLHAIDLPLFLAPAFADLRISSLSRRCFASSVVQCKKPDQKKPVRKGPRISQIRTTPRRKGVRIDRVRLPEPAEDALKRRKEFKTSENHGLWGFFNQDKKAMVSPEEEAAYGRPWTYQELSVKAWDDLYKLHWACLLELNRTRTREHEMRRLKAGYGANEVEDRAKVIHQTMSLIKSVLLDRHLNYVEARNLLEEHDDARALLEETVLEDSEGGSSDWQDIEPTHSVQNVSYPPVQNTELPPT